MRSNASAKRSPLHDARTEAAARLIERNESGKLAVEGKAAHGEDAALLQRAHSEKLHVVFGFCTEVGGRSAGVECASNWSRQVVDRDVERNARDDVVLRIQPLRDELAA